MILKLKDGDVKIELFEDVAPNHVKRIKELADSGQYDNVVFHRVIDGFMIQGGGFDENMNQKETDAPIKNEASNGLKNEAYTLAMARTSIPDSATSQFFINVSDNSFLDFPGQDGAGYCVFGKVTKGMDVIDLIKSVTTGSSNGHQDVPTESIIIEDVTLC